MVAEKGHKTVVVVMVVVVVVVHVITNL